ncbi:hypothetical protein T440DRAFT_245092 [Plenodomus tracheiphilus IPT5]|uniref:Uncharacterized protein n=1 Tax=Plenodomus tracheiphilus IPT5 TaxID=1408161 RepID=A0A6A7BL46_9PLEO|nr:hypothetical protein T440DRAFT_245092 [Plenodomus tracheiphilus IPT5]
MRRVILLPGFFKSSTTPPRPSYGYAIAISYDQPPFRISQLLTRRTSRCPLAVHLPAMDRVNLRPEVLRTLRVVWCHKKLLSVSPTYQSEGCQGAVQII